MERVRDCASLRCFPPCPVALGWIYALDLEEHLSVCVCLCARGTNERVCRKSWRRQVGLITHKHALCDGTKKRSHTETLLINSFLLAHFLFRAILAIFSAPLNGSAIARAHIGGTYTYESNECTSPPGAFSSLCSSFPLIHS